MPVPRVRGRSCALHAAVFTILYFPETRAPLDQLTIPGPRSSATLLDQYTRRQETITAQRWRERDPFIGPMRYDHDSPDSSPYLVTYGGGRQPVRDGDWIVRDSCGRYSVMRDREFRDRFGTV